MQQVLPEDLSANAFTRIGKQWMLITTRQGDKTNAMTASWGGMGVMWGKPVVMTVVRPQRYTYELLEAAGEFALCFLPEAYRPAYQLLGTESGRDGDKIARSGLTLCETDGMPAFTQSELTLCCRVLYKQDMDSSAFTDTSIPGTFYAAGDYHRLYVSQVLSAWTI